MGRDFWGGLLDWLRAKMLVEGTISDLDLELFHVTDDPEEAVLIIKRFSQEVGVAPNF